MRFKLHQLCRESSAPNAGVHMSGWQGTATGSAAAATPCKQERFSNAELLLCWPVLDQAPQALFYMVSAKIKEAAAF